MAAVDERAQNNKCILWKKLIIFIYMYSYMYDQYDQEDFVEHLIAATPTVFVIVAK